MAGRGGRTGASRREDMLRALMQQQGSGMQNPLASRPAADQPVEPKGSMQETLEEPASVSEPLQGSPLMQQEGPPSRGLAGSPQDAISALAGGGADQLPESLGQMDPRRRKLLEMLQQMGAGQQMQR